MKLTPSQSTVLRLIERHGGIWYPLELTDYLEGERLSIGGAGMAAAIKALWRKGLAENVSVGTYASRLTPEGKRVVAAEKGKPLAFLSII